MHSLTMNYEGRWHMVMLQPNEKWLFDGETLSEINTIKGLCWSINNTIEENEKMA